MQRDTDEVDEAARKSWQEAAAIPPFPVKGASGWRGRTGMWVALPGLQRSLALPKTEYSTSACRSRGYAAVRSVQQRGRLSFTPAEMRISNWQLVSSSWDIGTQRIPD